MTTPQPANPNPTTAEVAASARGLTKHYGQGDAQVIALAGVDVDFRRGEFTAVMGPSGSGKSTLMHCAAGLDVPTSGEVMVGETAIGRLKDKELTQLRRDRVGFIFQAFNLVPTLTAEENILLPLAIAGRQPDPDWYRRIIDTVGLGDRLGHKPSELSGGQQQRVACARALVGKPEIIFADEPTGNLDSRSSAEVLAFLRQSVDDFGQTIVMVTHDPVAASYADRALFLADGRIVGDVLDPTRESVLDQMARLDPRFLDEDAAADQAANRRDAAPSGTTLAAENSAADNSPAAGAALVRPRRAAEG
ncbi:MULTISPECIES: ABC transporter ATP-binding protein [unclassified Luteococcus]|uniref:ABC transporter ATP-binding protein n=1 Tax=unclassified Luteococcus TaxID=2639923 RepID=UPI00313C55B7